MTTTDLDLAARARRLRERALAVLDDMLDAVDDATEPPIDVGLVLGAGALVRLVHDLDEMIVDELPPEPVEPAAAPRPRRCAIRQGARQCIYHAGHGSPHWFPNDPEPVHERCDVLADFHRRCVLVAGHDEPHAFLAVCPSTGPLGERCTLTDGHGDPHNWATFDG